MTTSYLLRLMVRTGFFILISLICSLGLSAQVVFGVVLEAETKAPLIGATVAINNTPITSTDFSGKFNFNLASTNDTLSIDYLGYKRQVLVLDDLALDEELTIELYSEDQILETTVITGSRYEKDLASYPVSINVIKPRLIDNTNTTKVDVLLDKIPGVQLIDGQANIRGGSGYSYGAGSRVMLLIDDVPAFQADSGRPLWDDIPVENIAQIEVLKGAASAIYGSAALNGIINIRTGYATAEPQTKISLAYTSFMDPKDQAKKWWDSAPSQWNVSLVHKRKIGKLDLVANGFYENFSSFYIDSFKKRYRYSANLKYRFSDRINFSLNTMFNYKDDGNYLLWANGRSGAYLGWDGTFTAGVTKRYYIDPQLSIYDKRNNKHKILARYYKLNNASTTAQATGSNNVFTEYQYSGKQDALGISFSSGLAAYFTQSDSELFGDIALGSDNYAAYLQVEKKLAQLELTLGGRYETNVQTSPEEFMGVIIEDGRVVESKFVKRVGLNYGISKGTNIRASWGEGYRFPTLAEKFIQTDLGGFFILPNPTLESETGWTTEIGVKQGLLISGVQAYLDFSIFRSRYSNMMEFTFGMFNGESGFQAQNVGNTQIDGFELNLIGQIKIGAFPINILSGYTYLNPFYRDFDSNAKIQQSIANPIPSTEAPNFLTYRNKHNFKIDLETNWKGLTLGSALNYTSSMVTIDQFLSNLNEIELYREANPTGFIKVDARLSYTYKAYKLSLIGQNILNEEFSIRPGKLEAPRNLSIRIDYKI